MSARDPDLHPYNMTRSPTSVPYLWLAAPVIHVLGFAFGVIETLFRLLSRSPARRAPVRAPRTVTKAVPLRLVQQGETDEHAASRRRTPGSERAS